MTSYGEETEYRQARFLPPAGSTELLLVRHGESAPARASAPFRLVDGHSDPELHPEGRWQAERVADRLGTERIDAIYITPLRRTAETAAPLVRKLNLTPKVEPGLREVLLGEWEGGRFRKMVADKHPIAQRMYAEQRWDVIPGAEPAEAFRNRVRQAVEGLAAAHPDQRLAVFTHGGVIGEILALATEAKPFSFVGADNGSISHIVVTDAGWVVRRYNDTAHLDSGFDAGASALT